MTEVKTATSGERAQVLDLKLLTEGVVRVQFVATAAQGNRTWSFTNYAKMTLRGIPESTSPVSALHRELSQKALKSSTAQ